MISAPVIPAHQKQMLTSKKFVKLFNKIFVLAFELLLSKLTLTGKLFDRFLRNNFNTEKVFLKMVPRLLTPKQKEIQMNICADILQNIENEPNFLENVITCNESWFFQYDPESERQSMHWKSTSSPRQKKAWQSKSKF